MKNVALGDSAFSYFGTASASTGAATNADSTPTVVVAEDGTDMGYVPTVTNVATGLYKVEIAATSGNGFEAGRRYNLYAVATVGGITGRDGIGEFEVLAVDLNTGVASVTGAVGSVTGLTAANLDVAVSTRMETYTQPTGFLAATFPGTVASTTNITAGTITTVSGNVTGSVGSVVGLTAANLDVAVSTRLATAGYTAPLDAAGTRTAVGLTSANLDTQIGTLLTSAAYTAPDNASITAIKAKTDSLVFTVAGQLDANVQYVNDVAVTGVGSEADPWGPA